MTWCEVWCLFGLNNFVIFIFLELPPSSSPTYYPGIRIESESRRTGLPQGYKPCRQVTTLIGRIQPQSILELRLLGRHLHTFNVIGRIGIIIRVHKFLSSSVRNHQASLKSNSFIEFQYLLNIYRAGRNSFESRIVIFIRKLNI